MNNIKRMKKIINLLGLVILVLNFVVGTFVLATLPIYYIHEYMLVYIIGLLMYSITKYGVKDLL